ncbi:MAG: CDP-diacylglycerol--serine O-phosphatidyltransferase [Bdellovibrionota bacterium]
MKKGIYLLPNLFTAMNLFFGFYAMIQGLLILIHQQGSLRNACLAIVAAMVFDAMDGRVARSTNSASQFGAEFDSLCDVVSFGVAPSLMMFIWLLQDFGRLGWLACFLFVVCSALRLARFNVQSKSIEKSDFQGLPTPMSAFMITSIIFLSPTVSHAQAYILEREVLGWSILSLTYMLSFLMISPIRYRGFKSTSLAEKHSLNLFFVLILIFVTWAIKPRFFFLLLSLTYVLSGPAEYGLTWILKRKKTKIKKRS